MKLNRRDFVKQISGVAGTAALLSMSGPTKAKANRLTPAKKNLNTKIGILGAGISGLTAAHYLNKKGYKNLKVIEKAPHVGGKVSTHYINTPDGIYPYELGAIVISPPTYPTIMRIIEDVSASLDDYVAVSCHLDPENDNKDKRIVFSGPYDALDGDPHTSMLGQGFEIWNAFVDNPEVDEMAKVGLGGDRSTYYADSFYEWGKKRGLSEGTIKTLERAITGIGYGDLKEVPAAYHMKYFPLHLSIKQLLFGKYFPESLSKKHLRAGYQNLWESVARNLNVVLNQDVIRITKDNSETTSDKIKVSYADGTDDVFDQLLLACPFEKIIDNVDSSLMSWEFDTSEFKKFNYYPMHNFLIEFESKEFEQKGITTAWFSKYYSKDFSGKPMLIVNRHPQFNIYNVYGDGTRGADKNEVLKNIENDFFRLGFKIKNIHAHNLWESYFPYIGSKDLKRGYFDRLEDLQGKNGLYYLTSRMNFETSEHSAQYGKHIADTFF